MGDEPMVGLSAIRRFSQISARIGVRDGLLDTLQAIVDGVVDGLGFGVAALNYRRPDGSFEVVAVAGPPEARAALLGQREPAESFDAELARAEEWDRLRFVPHERLPVQRNLTEWIPDIPVQAGPDAWHPLDALYAPLHGPSGELIALLSVDLPVDGRRPGRVQRELLELYALQAGIAIDAARLTERLRLDEEALRLTFEGSSGGMGIVSLEPGTAGRFLRVNEALCRLVGRGADELLATPAAQVLGPGDSEADPDMESAARGEIDGYRAERRWVHPDGSVVWLAVLANVVDSGGRGGRWLVVQADDITARKHVERRLHRQATHDPLTGLPNRRLLQQRLAAALKRDRTAVRPGAVLFCDLDDFRLINDRYGHLAGDEALREVAERLRGQVRADDTVARFGGDEFVVLVEDISLPDVDSLRRRILREVERPLAGTGVVISISVGVAVLGCPRASVDEILHAADQAMYAARRGRPA